MLVYKAIFQGAILQLSTDIMCELLDAGYTLELLSYDYLSHKMASRLITASRQYLDNYFNDHFSDIPF